MRAARPELDSDEEDKEEEEDEDEEPRCVSCGRREGDAAAPRPLRDDVQRVANLLQRRFPEAGGVDRGDEDDDDFLVLELETCVDCAWVVCGECALGPKGACRCPFSNMGVAYADTADGPAAHMGASGGARYVGPFKCRAQREMEAKLMLRRDPGHAPYLEECGWGGCRKALTPETALLCTRCRSEVYCSSECQAKAWSTPHPGVYGTHAENCGPYLAPEMWPYTSRDLAAYCEHWGRFPTAKLSAAQRASDEALRVRLSAEAEETDELRRAYLAQRNSILESAGIGDLAAELTPMEI